MGLLASLCLNNTRAAPQRPSSLSKWTLIVFSETSVFVSALDTPVIPSGARLNIVWMTEIHPTLSVHPPHYSVKGALLTLEGCGGRQSQREDWEGCLNKPPVIVLCPAHGFWQLQIWRGVWLWVCVCVPPVLWWTAVLSESCMALKKRLVYLV